jgi:hypothetical protein
LRRPYLKNRSLAQVNICSCFILLILLKAGGKTMETILVPQVYFRKLLPLVVFLPE